LTDAARRWRSIARDIHAEVCRRGFDRPLNSFVQAYGSKELDASPAAAAGRLSAGC
jgi:GH15 family glucan-1,4-alpha-glucosidase